jgi:hypothetical protein
MKVVSIIFGAVLSFGQTTTKKDTSQAATADAWQKSKECASQAEKTMADFDRRSVAAGGAGFVDWKNHYSPKYNRCFITADYVSPAKDGGGKYVPFFSTELIDAFERSILANSASGGPTDGFCDIDHEPVDCAKAASFISEHMKN